MMMMMMMMMMTTTTTTTTTTMMLVVVAVVLMVTMMKNLLCDYACNKSAYPCSSYLAEMRMHTSLDFWHNGVRQRGTDTIKAT